MEKKNYYGQVKNLHNEVVAEIKNLMTQNGKKVADLAGSVASHAFVMGVPDFDWYMDYVEAEVMSVILEDGQVKLDINWDIDTEEYLALNPNENDDIGELYTVVEADDFKKLIPCAGISSVYDALWDKFQYGYVGDNDEDM